MPVTTEEWCKSIPCEVSMLPSTNMQGLPVGTGSFVALQYPSLLPLIHTLIDLLDALYRPPTKKKTQFL
jgi:hypothetical protein